MLKRISLCVTSSLVLACAPAAHAHIVDNVLEHSAPNAALQLTPIGSHESGVLGKSAAEIVAYHAASQRVLTVNARSGEIDILDASDPTQPQKIGAISAGGDKEINSVAVRPDGLAVAAVQQADKTGNGEALFFNAATGQELGRVGVGALPDNVHLTADGRHALVANEGEPSDALNAEGTAYLKDPEGSISVISLPADVAAPALNDVHTAGFTAFDTADLDPSIRVFGPSEHHNLPSRDFEPEYISSADGKAYATLQENNAIAVIDIESATVEQVIPAHIADHSEVPLDPSNKDDVAELRTIPVKGLSMPDSIGAFEAGGQTYFATANEGDAREWGGYTDEVELKDLVKDGKVCDDLKVGDRTYAFIGAERVGGIFVYDVTAPAETKFVTYVNNRDFSVDYDENDVAATTLAGDLGPEGLAFVPAADSPTDDALLIAGNEVSGTTTVFSVKDLLADDTDSPAASGSSNGSSNSSSGSSVAAGIGIVAGLIGLGALIGGALGFLPKTVSEFYALLPAQVRKLLP